MMLTMILAMMLQQQPAAHEYTDVLQVHASELYAKYVAENETNEEGKRELKELFRFKDFVGTSMEGKPVNFHLPSEPGFAPAKVLILTYVADWCVNCNYEAPYLRELYLKYHARGLEIVSRSEYSEVEKMREMNRRHDTPYPVITGSVVAYDARETIRLETFQYLLRKTIGDTRKWGTPFSIIVLNGDIENPYVVMGEMKSDQVNALIEKALGDR